MDYFSLNNFIVSMYVVLWLFTYRKYQKQRNIFDAGSFLLCLYIVYAIASFILYNINEYNYHNNNIRILPFIYLFVILVVSFIPVLKFNSNVITKIQAPTNLLLHGFATIIVFCGFYAFWNSFEDFLAGVQKIIYNPSGGQELYNETLSRAGELGDGISNIFAIFFNAFYNFGVLLLFFFCTLKKTKRNNIIIILLSLSCLLGILIYIGTGQRGGTIKRLFIIIATYFAMRTYIHESINYKIKRLGIIIVILTSIPFLALTVSRHGNKSGGTSYSIIDYAGQANLNFNKYAFDNNGIRYGDRTFPIFKKIAGFDNVPNNFIERRSKYPELKINDEVFVTYVGDFVLDFGPIIAAVFIILFTYLMIKLSQTKGKTILFHQLLIFHFVLSNCILGGSLYDYADTGNLALISNIFIYLIFLIDYESTRNKTFI